MLSTRIWALDLGRSAVKGVLLTAVRDGVEILDADIIALKGSPPEDVKDPSRDKRLWAALSEFEASHRISRSRVAIAIPAQNTLSRDITIALVGRRTVEELVRFEASNAIPFVLDEVCWDYHLFESPQDGAAREGIIFAAKKAAIQTYMLALGQIGVERVVDISLAPLSALSFLNCEMGGQGCAMLLDLGAENVSIVAMDGPRFWVRNLLTGGNRITWLLHEKFEIPFEQAEEAKQNIARSDFAEHFLEALKPGLHELAGELKTNLEYFRSIGKRTEFDRIYAVGGTSRLIGVKAQIKRSLGQDLHEIRSLEHVFVSPDADVRMIQGNLDRLMVAIGAGIKALGRGAVEVSFVPPSTARIARGSKAHWSLLASGVLLWAILLAAFLFARTYDEQLRPAAAAYEDFDRQFRAQFKDLTAARDTSAVDQELEYFMALGQDRLQVPLVMADVVEVFENANKNPDHHFVLTSFSCVQRQSEYAVAIEGRVNRPIDRDEAYAVLKSQIVGGLRNCPHLARATGTAKFANQSPKVAGNKTRWKALIAKNDSIVAVQDGIWYTVGNVTSDAELELTQPFEGGNLESPFAVCRLAVEVWNFETSAFRISASVPVGAAGASPRPAAGK